MRLLNSISDKLSGLFLNLISTKSKPPSPQLVAQRFRQLFTDHGLEETQIPRVFPKIALDDLTSDEKLIQKLTPELINEAAQLFNVRSRWLDGIDCSIYDHISCYKQPELFFQILNKIKFGYEDFPFRIVTHVKPLDLNNSSQQSFSILFVEKVASLDDQNIHRYYLDTGWDWSYEPCRIQIKAMALLYYQRVQTPITIYQVPHDIYIQIENHELIPHRYLVGSLTSDPSLEDYISDPKNSVVAKEFDELVNVYQYVEDHKLREISLLRSDINVELPNDHMKDVSTLTKNAISEMNSKNAKEKYKSLVKIKKDFIRFYHSKKFDSRKGAAREFFDALTHKEKIQLVPTYDSRDPEQSQDKATRTLTTALREFSSGNPPDWLDDFKL